MTLHGAHDFDSGERDRKCQCGVIGFFGEHRKAVQTRRNTLTGHRVTTHKLVERGDFGY